MGQVLSSGKGVVEHMLLKGILGPNAVNTSQEEFRQSFMIGFSQENDNEEIK